MPNAKEIEVFTLLLQHFGIYENENLYKVVCPFHADKNASMQINVTKCFFYCYGCGAHGTSVDLYKAFHKLETGKEITDLKANMEISKIIKGKTRTYDSTTSTTLTTIPFVEKESYKQGITEARNYYYNLPIPNWYKASKSFGTEEETRECINYMRNRGFRAKALTNAQAKPSLNKYYPIIFPLLENGVFRGYVMRTFDKEIEQERKYMYNRGFKRERTLAGYYKGYDTVLIVEGYIDCLNAQNLGIPSVVAILGWKISGTQLSKLKKAGIKHIICGTDNDEAGKKGYNYLKLIQQQQKWFKLSRLHYPKGVKDFGDLRKGTPQAERTISQVKNYFC